jgi:hypothetical protein
MCPFLSWGDWTLRLSREDREQHKVSRIAWVICSPADGTPWSKHLLSTRWCPSSLEPYSETVLNRTFPNRWIGRDGPIPGPSRSRDITPLDFSFWAYVKDKVFRPNFVVLLNFMHESTVQLLLWHPRCWKTHDVESSTVWTFWELQMTLALRWIEIDGLFFQVKQTNSLYHV